MNIYFIWGVYYRLFHAISIFAAEYISLEASHKVARYSIARLFQMATVAYELPEGPLCELHTIAVPLIVAEASSEGTLRLSGRTSFEEMYDEQLICDAAAAYAMVYKLQYFGQWSQPFRQLMAMHIRMISPDPLGDRDPYRMIENGGDALVPLRCAVDVALYHTCGEQLICEAAAQLKRDVENAGLLWLRLSSPLKGGG